MITLPFMKGKKVVVLGLGKTGRSVVDALTKSGCNVIAFDDKTVPYNGEELGNIDALVVSPGVPFFWPKIHPLVRAAKDKLIPVISDLDLFSAVNTKPIIGITGTNGKSTVTALTGHILKENGYNVEVGGNFGNPILSLNENADVFVLELSSYQLELSVNPKINVAVSLNITPDHLHRHGGMAGYITAKQKIFSRSNFDVIGVDDEHSKIISEFLEEVGHKVLRISGNRLDDGIIGWGGDKLYDFSNSEKGFICSTTEYLEGNHNKQNIAATYAALKSFGLTKEQFLKGLNSFKGLEHRQEIVCKEIAPALVINDSKATNADAVEQAFLRFSDKNIIWIAGGLPKEGGISSLQKYFGSIKKAFLIGQAENEFYDLLVKNDVESEKCTELKIAVQKALSEAANSPNAVVLFSPACASFDQFKSFEERGRIFKEYVREFLENGVN